MGGERDFEYFLPRLLELKSTEGGYPDAPVLFDKLRLAHWEKWPDRRRAAVKRLVDAWYVDCLNAERWDGFTRGFAINELLCGIAHAGIPLAEYLRCGAVRAI